MDTIQLDLFISIVLAGNPLINLLDLKEYIYKGLRYTISDFELYQAIKRITPTKYD